MEMYWEDRNPNYPEWSVNCANFVSQSLRAGGLDMVSSVWYVSEPIVNNWWKPTWAYNAVAFGARIFGYNMYFNNETLNGMSVGVSSTWNSANAQYQYFSNPANGFINGEILAIDSSNMMQMLRDNNIQMSDLLYWSNDGGNTMYHATIISRVTDTGIYYAGNTSSRFDHPLMDSIGNGTVYIVRLKDELFD
jgi:hypothetical protein